MVLCSHKRNKALEKRRKAMGMILDDDFNELMINTQTGEFFKRVLSREEKADAILAVDENLMGPHTKLKKLQGLGYELEEVLEMCLNFKD
jgi:hypothetical protein